MIGAGLGWTGTMAYDHLLPGAPSRRVLGRCARTTRVWLLEAAIRSLVLLISLIVIVQQVGIFDLTAALPTSAVQPMQGHAFSVTLDGVFRTPWWDTIVYEGEEDTNDAPRRSALRILEDGRELGPSHSLHEDVFKKGAGRYSHWANTLIFASSDNTDPRTNGRSYVVRVPAHVTGFLLLLVALLIGVTIWRHWAANRYPMAEIALAANLLRRVTPNSPFLNALLLIASTLLCIAAGELAARWMRGDAVRRVAPYPSTSSDYLPFTLGSNMSVPMVTSEFEVVYRTNQLGYRGKFPGKIGKPNGTRRVILLGDSFTLGWGVNEDASFAGLLTKEFESYGVEIINAAYHAGYSLDSYYAYMRREGLPLSPDLAVVFIYSGNDLSDMTDSFWMTVDDSGAPLSLRTSRRYAGPDGVVSVNASPCERTYSLTRSYLITLACTFVVSPPPAVRMLDFSQTADAKFSVVLKAFSRLANTVPIIYVLIPPPQLYGLHYRSGDRTLQEHEQISGLMQAKPLLDATSFLNASHYYQQDGHLTARGHDAIAEHLSPLLRLKLAIR